MLLPNFAPWTGDGFRVRGPSDPELCPLEGRWLSRALPTQPTGAKLQK